MAYFSWQDFLSSGVGAIDEEHKGLLELLNRLADPTARGNRALLTETLDLLTESAAAHFAAEERMMADSGYPFAEAHRRRHREMAAGLEQWRQRVRHGWWPWLGGSFQVNAVNNFVRHIVEQDHPFTEFLLTGRTGRNRLAGGHPTGGRRWAA